MTHKYDAAMLHYIMYDIMSDTLLYYPCMQPTCISYCCYALLSVGFFRVKPIPTFFYFLLEQSGGHV